MGGVLVRKHLNDKFRDVDAKEEKGMTHGLVGGNIRAAWVGKQGKEGNRSKVDWEETCS